VWVCARAFGNIFCLINQLAQITINLTVIFFFMKNFIYEQLIFFNDFNNESRCGLVIENMLKTLARTIITIVQWRLEILFENVERTRHGRKRKRKRTTVTMGEAFGRASRL